MNAKIWTGLVVLIGSFAPAATAQQPQDSRENQRGFGPTLSIQFPGGSLEDYVKELKSAAPAINVVNTVPESKSIRLPAIKLDSVPYGPAISVLSGEYRIDDRTTVRVYFSDLGPSLSGDQVASVYKLSSEVRQIPRPPVQVRVWNLSGLIGSQRKAEDILTAIDTAVGLLEGHDEAKIRYHAETSLVMASGDPEQLQAIDRVIVGLHQTGRKSDERRSAAQTNETLRDLFDSLSEGKAPPEVIKHFGDLQQDLQDKDRTISELRHQLGAKKE